VVVHNSRKTHDKIKVFDNYIDLSLYKYPQPFKDDGIINLTHFGSTTHFTDLQNKSFVEGIDRIMKDYPNVNFITVGSFIPMFRQKWGQRYQNEFGNVDVYKWISDHFPGVMAKTDICVVPLENNVYTRCKSDIKRSEMSSAVKPFVAQRIRQYEAVIDDGVDGMLCDSALEWYTKIKKLIDDKELRKSMGVAGYERVKRDKQMKDHVDQYGDFFCNIDKQTKKD